MKSKAKKSFYDRYHKDNRNAFYFKVISDNNFTYFYTLKYLKKALNIVDVNQRNLLGAEAFASVKGDQENTIEVLDLGCGVGTIDFYLAQKGYLVTGIDISADAIKICNQVKKQLAFEHTEFVQGDVLKAKFKKQFDLIICSEVIEHVQDDAGLLKKIRELLKPNGVLLLTTPSLHAPLYKMGLLKDFDQRVGHLRRYELDQLEASVINTGFELMDSAKAESIVRNSLYTFHPLGYLIKFIRGPLIPLFHLFDRLVCILVGESDLIVIGKKA